MNRLFNMILNKKKHIDLIQRISVDSTIRMQKVFVLLGIMQFLQFISYVIQPERIDSKTEIYVMKVIAVLLCMLFWFVINLLNKANKFLLKHVEEGIIIITGIMLIWAILNTYYAQSITSDMSIYLMMVFTCVAVVRLRPIIGVVLYGVAYIVFAIGIPRFQTDPDNVVAHLSNGLIMTILAIAISTMFYRYAMGDYFVHKQVHTKTEEINYLNEMDMLTDNYNHHTFYELLHKSLEEQDREILNMYLFMIDIDDFSKINDRFGHRFGNEVLRHVGKILKANSGPKDIVARYGNDEFLMVMKEGNLNEARRRIIRIREDLLNFDTHGCKITFSGGLAKWEYESADQFISKVDKLCRTSQMNGKNQVTGC